MKLKNNIGIKMVSFNIFQLQEEINAKHFNYRVVEDSKNKTIGIYGVYYSSDGNPMYNTIEPVIMVAKNKEELSNILEHIKEALNNEVLEIPSEE